MTNLTRDDYLLIIGSLYVENVALKSDMTRLAAMQRAPNPDDDPPDAPASMPLPEAPSDDSEGASALKEAA